MTAHGWFNAAESILWLAVATTVYFRAPLPGRQRLTAALAFLAFGVSDLIEINTGAWWHPWWLLALKAGCVATFTPAVIAWLRRSRKNN